MHKTPQGVFLYISPCKSVENQGVTAKQKGYEGMGTESAGNILAERMAQFKQRQGNTTNGVQAFVPTPQKIDGRLIAVKPIAKSWEELVKVLDELGALDADGLYRQLILKTVRDLYNQGYCTEIETAAELAQKLASKKPVSHYFAASVSKRSGNWVPVTLPKVNETWEVRKNALDVMEKLKLDSKITNYVLSLSWKLKGVITRFLAIATEQGYGITNPAGYFFGIIKNAQTAT